MRGALDNYVLMPQCALEYEQKTRMPTADLHVSNIATEESYARDFPRESVHKFHCQAHVEHRVAERGMSVFPQEKRGMLHTHLAFTFGGVMCAIKQRMKHFLRNGGLMWIDVSHSGVVPHDKFRDLVY